MAGSGGGGGGGGGATTPASCFQLRSCVPFQDLSPVPGRMLRSGEGRQASSSCGGSLSLRTLPPWTAGGRAATADPSDHFFRCNARSRQFREAHRVEPGGMRARWAPPPQRQARLPATLQPWPRLQPYRCDATSGLKARRPPGSSAGCQSTRRKPEAASTAVPACTACRWVEQAIQGDAARLHAPWQAPAGCPAAAAAACGAAIVQCSGRCGLLHSAEPLNRLGGHCASVMECMEDATQWSFPVPQRLLAHRTALWSSQPAPSDSPAMAHYGLDEYPPGYQTNPYCIEVGARCSLPAATLAHV